jgi:diguanylate cyclase (GGDEF)-like protein
VLTTEEALMQFLYRAPVGLVQITADGAIEMINPMSARLLMPLSSDGYLDNLFGVLETVAPQIRQMVLAFEAPAGPVCEALRITIPFSVPAPTGRMNAAQVLSISVLKLDDNRMMAMLSDVTLEAQREQSGLALQLDAAGRTDDLTKMPNRTGIRELIDRAIDRRRQDPQCQFAVVFINCDRFKQINDALGYTVGDEVLAEIADRLRSTLRQRDRLGSNVKDASAAGRLGGDEFVVVLDDVGSVADVRAVAERLLRELSRPYGVQAQKLHVSTSMGIVIPDVFSVDANKVLQDASIAMVEAKRGGGSRYVHFEQAMYQRAALRGDLESDLRRALTERQLFVVYQPVVKLQPEADCMRFPVRSAGVEALVRWRHPLKGIISPVEFIGVAEECGLIGALGAFVLETACRQFMAWQSELGRYAPRLLAVNLSRAQLYEEGFVASVKHLLFATGMPAEKLQLEVTESLAAQDAVIQERLEELQALGLTLALDDFGTGYSSLSSLHQLPVTTVKIDRSFVGEAETSAHHRVLVEATVRVAASLAMITVAEGIETVEQARIVRALGCDKGQGYLFSKPLMPEELARWVSSETTLPGA